MSKFSKIPYCDFPFTDKDHKYFEIYDFDGYRDVEPLIMDCIKNAWAIVINLEGQCLVQLNTYRLLKDIGNVLNRDSPDYIFNQEYEDEEVYRSRVLYEGFDYLFDQLQVVGDYYDIYLREKYSWRLRMKKVDEFRVECSYFKTDWDIYDPENKHWF